LGTNQDTPTTVDATAIAPTGPPLIVGGIDSNPEAAETTGTGMRLGVMDKDAAIRAERQARSDARALETFVAQQTANADYAAAVVEAQLADRPAPAPPAPVITAPAPTAAPTPVPDEAPVPDDTGGGGGGNGRTLYQKLDDIAECESGRNPDAYNPEGPWYGAFQFRRDTWRSYGGGRGDIRDYTYGQQREVAASLARDRGFAGSWPTCAARYGYA
jgi:hypothetical protein